MSLVAAIVDWDVVEGPSLERLGGLLSALPGRAPDGRFFVRGPHAALGLGRRIVRSRERSEIQPLRDQRRRLCVVGDLRLDNREELRSLLADGTRPLTSDVALLAAGYDRWREGLAERLIGDFAFVIWDWFRRQLYAARDPFGVRSLVYRACDGSLALATEPGQFLAWPDVDRSPDDQTVVDSLSWSYAHYGSTFFSGIRSIRPGHYLLARESGLREVRYFLPPTSFINLRRRADYHEQFQVLFRTAVKDRLDSESPIVSQLSGGLDSSSIACMAHRIYADRGEVRPPLILASALFPGKSNNEEPFVDAVAGQVSFLSRRWDGNVPSGREFSRPALSIPGASVSFNGGSAGDLDIASSIESRVLLSGEGGDYVTGEMGLFNDLVVAGRWLTACRQIAIAESLVERRSRTAQAKAALKAEAPAILGRLWDMRRSRPAPSPPPWLHRDVSGLWTDRHAPIPSESHPWLSRLERECWRHLTMARMGWAIDCRGVYAADAGIEVRYPFLDTRVVRFLLAVPPEHRLVGGIGRWFHREALRDYLPPAVLTRGTKGRFIGAVVEWGYRSLASIREIIAGSSWLSERFIAQGEAQKLLNRLASRSPSDGDWNEWRDIRSIVNIETWRRAVLEYPTSKERLPMSEVTDANEDEKAGGDVGSVAGRLPYAPPRLVPVGNVRDLLAGAPGSTTDGEQFNTQP